MWGRWRESPAPVFEMIAPFYGTTTPNQQDAEAVILSKILAALNIANGGPVSSPSFYPEGSTPMRLDNAYKTLQKILGAANAIATGGGGDLTALENAVFGGANVPNSTLELWSTTEAYRMQIALEDVSGVITSAVLLWPDGSSGTYNVQTINTTWNAPDGWVLTHTDSGKTITQLDITRSAINGIPLVTPDLIIT